MNFLTRLFTPPARTLALQGIAKRKALIRATCDQMRRDMGLPAINWDKLRG